MWYYIHFSFSFFFASRKTKNFLFKYTSNTSHHLYKVCTNLQNTSPHIPHLYVFYRFFALSFLCYARSLLSTYKFAFLNIPYSIFFVVLLYENPNDLFVYPLKSNEDFHRLSLVNCVLRKIDIFYIGICTFYRCLPLLCLRCRRTLSYAYSFRCLCLTSLLFVCFTMLSLMFSNYF